MKQTILMILLLLIAVPVGAETTYHHAIGIDYGLSNFSGVPDTRFPYENSIGIRLSTYMKGKWRLEFSFAYEKIYDDSTASSFFKVGSTEENRTYAWKSYNMSLMAKYRFLPLASRFSIDAGIGAGIANWRLYDAQADTLLNAPNERDEIIDLAATEVMIALGVGMEFRVARNVKFDFDIQTNYLTGWGQEFEPSVEENLGNWNTRISFGISLLIGEKFLGPISNRDIGPQNLSKIYLESIRGELTGPQYAFAYNQGPDTDGDGIPDLNDLCPNTSPAARGLIDIHGCPIDSDCDGYPNYIDECPNNPIGSLVDTKGCPLDSDGDGVPDGIDNCPNSDPSLKIDPDGCVNIESLKVPMNLYIRYESGSFEIDPEHKRILEDLSKLLIKAKVIKVEINGYTDNIGTSDANKELSQKRANRVKDYLIRLGVDKSRLKAYGRGETNFLAPNDTLDGRKKNRRVELIFYK